MLLLRASSVRRSSFIVLVSLCSRHYNTISITLPAAAAASWPFTRCLFLDLYSFCRKMDKQPQQQQQQQQQLTTCVMLSAAELRRKRLQALGIQQTSSSLSLEKIIQDDSNAGGTATNTPKVGGSSSSKKCPAAVDDTKSKTNNGSNSNNEKNMDNSTTSNNNKNAGSSSKQRSHNNNSNNNKRFASVACIDLCDSSDDDDDDDDDAIPSAVVTKRSTANDIHQKRARLLPMNHPNAATLKQQDKVTTTTTTTATTTSATAAAKGTAATTCNDIDNDDDSFFNTSSSSCFRLATYNVWFGPSGDGSPHPRQRMTALCQELFKSPPPLPPSTASNAPSASSPLYFCGFQEVIQPLSVTLRATLEAAGYKWIEQPAGGAPYRCAMAILQQTSSGIVPTILDSGWRDYQDTVMGRGFLHVRAQLPFTTDEVLFTTTHLESWTGPTCTGAQARLNQVRELEAFCQEQLAKHDNLQMAIITGDLNWDDASKKPNDPPLLHQALTNAAWKDAWLETTQGPGGRNNKNNGYTYDGSANAMLSNSLRRRFDRCLTLSRHPHHQQSKLTASSSLAIAAPPPLVPTQTYLIGTNAIPGGLTFEKYNTYKKTYRSCPVCPSDHFGLVVQIGK